MLQSFTEQLNRYQTRCNKLLEELLSSSSTGNTLLHEAMQYSLLQGGKRVRPALVYAAAEAAGSINKGTDLCACAIEAIHTYSLIHDDLPAMDNDLLRRGKPTCHIKFDEATAILTGDALQCLAFEWLTRPDSLSAEVAVRATHLLAQAAGANGMVLGQAIDLSAVSLPLSIAQLETMHRHKTGALIEASVALGALSVGAPSSVVSELRTYATAIGLAFQVQDDILDVISDTQTLGKNQGADAKNNKPTYVSLLGLEGAKSKALDLRDTALLALQNMGENAHFLRSLATYVVERNH